MNVVDVWKRCRHVWMIVGVMGIVGELWLLVVWWWLFVVQGGSGKYTTELQGYLPKKQIQNTKRGEVERTRRNKQSENEESIVEEEEEGGCNGGEKRRGGKEKSPLSWPIVTFTSNRYHLALSGRHDELTSAYPSSSP
jgi:hypothetical protein